LTDSLKNSIDKKIINNISDNTELNTNHNQLGYYLAGLIEGDGSIIVPYTIRNKNGKLLYPKIKITFVGKDAPLANKLKNVLKNGTIESPKNKDYVNLLIQDTKTLYVLTKLINGKMRTPKIEALHRLVDWFNNRSDFENLPKLNIDKSSLGSNAWLSGFLEADGNFYNGFTLNSDNIVDSVKSYMRVSQRKTYHKESNTNEYTDSYLFVMETITDFLSVSNVREISRVKPNYTEQAYEVKTNKKESSQILINYLEKFPLFSSKYLDFLVWVEIQALSKSELTGKSNKSQIMKNSNLLIELKNSMNSKRTKFNWDHLNNFYKY